MIINAAYVFHKLLLLYWHTDPPVDLERQVHSTYSAGLGSKSCTKEIVYLS